MDIMSTINQAGGVGAIAQKLGIDEDTAQRGIGALLPPVVNGVEQNGLPADATTAVGAGADPSVGAEEQATGSGLGGILGGLMGGGAGGGLLSSMLGGGGAGIGNQILGHIFGSKDASRDVAAQASQESGVDTSVLKKLLPIVAGAVAMHYITHRGQDGATVDAGAPAGGGGILGSILGGLAR